MESHYLSSNDKNPASQEGDAPPIKRLDDIYDTNRISRSATESAAGIGEDGDQDVLFDVERPRVERHLPVPEPGDPEGGPGEHRRHEVADRQRRHLHRDLGDHEGLRPVGEELVQEGEEHA